MHRGVRDKLEETLAGTADELCERHLTECEECRTELAAMREQRVLLRSLRADGTEAEIEPAAGFYARVMERIETQGVASIWSLFFDSPVGRRVAMASMAVALSLGVYLVSSERNAGPESIVLNSGVLDSGQVVMQGTSGMLTGAPDADSVLVNLVTYREQ